MRSASTLLAATLAVAVAMAPGLALARAGGGHSFGSRGARTFMAPPVTRTAPFAARPFERSITPRPAPGAAPYQSPRSRYGGFAGGLMGGLLGVGLGHLLFGGGGGFGFLGALIKLAILFFVIRWLFRLVTGRQPAFAGAGRFARAAMPGATMPGGSVPGGGAATGNGLAITRPDYQEFERILIATQAAWTAQDLNRLRQVATPEMVSVFAEQLADYASRGLHNEVTAVHLDQGDLSEAWSEGGRDYATVAMRFSMVDVTRDEAGRVVEGDPSRHAQATELWTFLRAPGGHWVLSGIQQGG